MGEVFCEITQEAIEFPEGRERDSAISCCRCISHNHYHNQCHNSQPLFEFLTVEFSEPKRVEEERKKVRIKLNK